MVNIWCQFFSQCNNDSRLLECWQNLLPLRMAQLCVHISTLKICEILLSLYKILASQHLRFLIWRRYFISCWFKRAAFHNFFSCNSRSTMHSKQKIPMQSLLSVLLSPGENLTFVNWQFEYRMEKVYGLWIVFLLWSHSMKARKQGDKLHVNMVAFWSLSLLEIISYWRILMPSWIKIWETTQQKQSRMVFQGRKMHLLIVF